MRSGIPDSWSALRGLPVRPADDGGLINATFIAGEPPRYVVQRVSPIFSPEVHDDIEAITAHLASRGLPTPRLLRTDAGALYGRDDEGAVWRAMDFIPGRTHHRVASPAVARSAGALVAGFHRAVEDLDHSYRHVRPGAHDTRSHMERLERASGSGEGRRLADAILEAWRTFQGRLDLPGRHCHGDLKISNVRFSEDGEGLCLIDLDTLALLPLDVELGDAWRSWCNPAGEDSADTQFDIHVFAAAVAGYRSVHPFTPAQEESLAGAVERIALELAARFCRDIFEDRYFGWDPARFPSRAAHNLLRARGQLSLALSARGQRREIERIVSSG
jgi:Ser/Thr protein kinase RdoA (MazF antagonist)